MQISPVSMHIITIPWFIGKLSWTVLLHACSFIFVYPSLLMLSSHLLSIVPSRQVFKIPSPLTMSTIQIHFLFAVYFRVLFWPCTRVRPSSLLSLSIHCILSTLLHTHILKVSIICLSLLSTAILLFMWSTLLMVTMRPSGFRSKTGLFGGRSDRPCYSGDGRTPIRGWTSQEANGIGKHGNEEPPH